MKKLEWGRYLLMIFLAAALLLGTAGAEETENEWLPQQMEFEQPAEVLDEPKLVHFDDPYISLDVTDWADHGDGEVSLLETSAYEAMKEAICSGIQNKQANITITNGLDRAITEEECVQLYFNTLFSYPELTYFAKTTADFSYYSLNPGGTIIFRPPYLATYDSDAYQRAVDAAANACFTDHMTPLEKVVAAHDWIVLNCQYDPYIAHDGPYTTAGGVTYGENDNVYTSYGVFVDGNAVCQGYALAFKVLMDRAGIPCCYVSNLSHAWNMVKLDGNWYHVDATWDDPVNISTTGDFAGMVVRNNFLKGETTFKESNHMLYGPWTTEYGYEASTSDYSLPTGLADASNTAAYLIDGVFYLMSKDGQLNRYQISRDFDTGEPVALITSEYLNRYIAAAAFDEENKRLYYKNFDEISELNLETAAPTFRLLELTGSYDPWYGLRLQDSASFPGAKELCTWYDYTAVETMLVGIESTSADMPVVIQFPASVMQIKNLAGKSISVTINSLPEGVTDGTVYLASYDAKGKMEKVAALGSLGTETPGKLVIDSSYLPQNAATAKILTVSNLGTPLATVIPCS